MKVCDSYSANETLVTDGAEGMENVVVFSDDDEFLVAGAEDHSVFVCVEYTDGRADFDAGRTRRQSCASVVLTRQPLDPGRPDDIFQICIVLHRASLDYTIGPPWIRSSMLMYCVHHLILSKCLSFKRDHLRRLFKSIVLFIRIYRTLLWSAARRVTSCR